MSRVVLLPSPAAPESTPPDHGGAVDLLRALWRGKGRLLLCVCCGIAAAIAASLLQTPMYQATALLEIQPPNENFLNVRDLDPAAPVALSSVDSYIQTQIDLLGADTLLERVVQALRLEQPAAPSWRSRLRLPGGEADPGARALESVRRHLKVAPARPGRLVRVIFESSNPRLAAALPNRLVEEFIAQSQAARWDPAHQTRASLNQQLQDLKAELERSERELQAYSQATGVLFTGGDKVSIAEQRLLQIQTELSKAQADRISRQALYEGTLTSPQAFPPALETNTLHDYQVKLTDLRRQLADLGSVLKPENYKVARVQAQIEELESALGREKQAIRQRTKQDYEAALNREALLADAYQRQARQVAGHSARAIRYFTLKREVDSNRLLYETVLQKVKEAGIATALRPAIARLVGAARIPAIPYKPDLGVNLGLGAIAGLTAGLLWTLLREQSDQRLRLPGEARSCLQLPELGAIPAAPREIPPAPRRLLSAPAALERVTWERRFSQLSESFREALPPLLSSPDPFVLVVTSSCPGEGKTTVASNFAIALAEIGRKVLLVDGDLRKPRLADIFEVPARPALSAFLSEDAFPDEIPLGSLASKTRVPNLYVLPSGPPPDSISRALHSARLPELLRRARLEFQKVVIDAPPLLQFADTRALARHADGVVLVVRANRTLRSAALNAVQRMAQEDLPVLGVLLNDWNPLKGGDYGYYEFRKHYYDAREPRRHA